MIRQCCRCKKVWSNGQWMDPLAGALEHDDVSHAYCEECFRREMRNIQRRAGRRIEIAAEQETTPKAFGA
jgi:hypothetical protein